MLDREQTRPCDIESKPLDDRRLRIPCNNDWGSHHWDASTDQDFRPTNSKALARLMSECFDGDTCPGVLHNDAAVFHHHSA